MPTRRSPLPQPPAARLGACQRAILPCSPPALPPLDRWQPSYPLMEPRPSSPAPHPPRASTGWGAMPCTWTQTPSRSASASPPRTSRACCRATTTPSWRACLATMTCWSWRSTAACPWSTGLRTTTTPARRAPRPPAPHPATSLAFGTDLLGSEACLSPLTRVLARGPQEAAHVLPFQATPPCPLRCCPARSWPTF